MLRFVVVNEGVDNPHAFVFSNESEAIAKAKEIAIPLLCEIYDYEVGDEELKSTVEATSIDDWPEWSEVMVFAVGESEVEVGVWTGFSSADRSAFGGELPLPEGEFIGNGDPSLYLTGGVVDGGVVDRTLSVGLNGVAHPLYESWLLWDRLSGIE